MYPRGFVELFAIISGGTCQLTLVELAKRLELDPSLGVLGQVERIKQILLECKLRVIPPLDRGELETMRVLTFERTSEISFIDDLNSDLAKEEALNLEFKSSLLFDCKRYAVQPEPKREGECRSDEVLYAALKTIAAFANSEGGRLYIGINDAKQVEGLKWDFLLNELRNEDIWQLYFRDAVLGKCKDGGMVNDYVEVNLFKFGTDVIARIDVIPRPALTFVKKTGQHLLFRRQGNRTSQIDICDMEEFLTARWNVDRR